MIKPFRFICEKCNEVLPFDSIKGGWVSADLHIDMIANSIEREHKLISEFLKGISSILPKEGPRFYIEKEEMITKLIQLYEKWEKGL